MSSVEILLLTEDTGDDAFAVLEQICRKMLRLVDDRADVRKVACVPADPPARQAMNFNGYRDRKNRQKRVDLVETLATWLMKNKAAFVIVHVDGDRVWSASQEGRAGTMGEAAFDFKQLILPSLELLLRDHGDEALTTVRLGHLFLAVPYKHMEAWLFQNTAALRQIYGRHYPAGHADLAIISRWEANPGLLDEEPDPKKTLARRDRDNLALAETFPARKALEVGKSFAATVERLSACGALRSVLAEIRF